ncbi:HEPN domain-containing protein [Chitinophaga sp. SYP-B3965]|uniref:HEPN domain-containing protein n=1 Tax=Chitinophaga sp. SYP-B3965 TaxID=2663120 RepID=UPI001299E2BD|nr:HEPN domain-containing protein [Chitinophaga sp. SYP-B3965]MRG44581.1 HEPN domain-containing protein [Chitinophaga sp. SYP-B3965]
MNAVRRYICWWTVYFLGIYVHLFSKFSSLKILKSEKIMLLKEDLRKIAQNRLKDSNILLQNKRYSAAMYLAGYAIELMLKLKICGLLRFKRGFPENETEFNAYKATADGASLLSTTITKLRQIKNHNLADLLKYSGKEVAVLARCPGEWAGISGWGPDQRYSARIIRKATAAEFIRNSKIIIENL